MRASVWLSLVILAACQNPASNGTDGPPGAHNPDGGGVDNGLYPFAYGMNYGYYNSSLTDVKASTLAFAAGGRSHRHKLTEPFLDQWGDSIHVNELDTMTKGGQSALICFLIGASAAHSNAPSGGDLEHYSPKNLYEPIFTTTGDVNPNNYWAAFVARVVTNYKPYIHQWEVWNEPDQVGGNWQATQSWTTSPPKPSDLGWWNDSIFAYIRMLRVTYAVVHKLDPDGKVTLGGIGYPSFLNAILRYTDEQTAGAVDAAHPDKGGAYFDIVSYHYYPVFAPGNSDVGAAGLNKARQALEAELDKAGVTGKTFVVTESGAPRYAFGSTPGGTAYARNYLAKAMTLAQSVGTGRIDWFILGDGVDAGASTDGFSYMGLYENLKPVTDPKNAIMTETGIAYATLAGALAGSLADRAATAALTLPSGTRGVALRTSDGKPAWVLWAETSDENGTGTVTLPSSGTVELRRWDYAKTQSADTRTPASGQVTIDVTSSPVVVLGK